MGGKDSNYTIVYRGDTLARMQEGDGLSSSGLRRMAVAL